MYGQQQSQQRQPRKPGNGRVWPQRQPGGNKPQFTGEITLPDGHVMRVSMWEQYGRDTQQFSGFSIKLSEDTRQGNGYQAQGSYGQPQGYGQQQGGYQPQQPPQNGYGGQPSAQHGYAGHPPAQQSQGGQGYNREGPQQPQPPVSAYQNGDEGYVPGFDD